VDDLFFYPANQAKPVATWSSAEEADAAFKLKKL